MRGTSSANIRGSAEDRRRRRRWILKTFGNGKRAPCRWCGRQLDRATLTVDRHPICGHDGGRYVRGNVVPACSSCNSSRCSKCVERGLGQRAAA